MPYFSKFYMNPGNSANLSFKKEKMYGWPVEEKI
jgi:hypothetical protein